MSKLNDALQNLSDKIDYHAPCGDLVNAFNAVKHEALAIKAALTLIADQSDSPWVKNVALNALPDREFKGG